MNTETVEFSLPNVGLGPDLFSLGVLASDVEFVVLALQRDHYCTNCREQVQSLADRIDEFHARNAEVVSIVPEPADRVEEWQSRYDLPYPLLADPDATVGAAYDQPVRFGVLGDVSNLLGRMPEVVIMNRRGDRPTIADAYKGTSTFGRPAIDDLLAELDELLDTTA